MVTCPIVLHGWGFPRLEKLRLVPLLVFLQSAPDSYREGFSLQSLSRHPASNYNYHYLNNHVSYYRRKHLLQEWGSA
jgi:hypothetical protein